jgi:tripartite-type tricarboxylate transporter receptor subunit TctC
MKKRIKKHVGTVVVFFLVFAYFPPDGIAKDPDYPTKPITFFITMGVGGTTDLAARAFIGIAAKQLGQPFVPVNKPGAGGTHAAMAVMSAKPDGYSLGVASPSTVFLAPFSDESPYKDLSGFTMIVNFGNFVYPLLVRTDAPWKTWQEFIEWARKNPRAAKIAITGARSVGSQGNIFWQIEKREQVEFTYIPFKSSAEVLSAILGGHITIFASTVDASTIPYLQ